MAKKRIKIPKKIEDEIMQKSEGKCYCGKRGDNIHHLDEKPDNNNFENLILLCYDHHHDASVKNGLKKKLTIIQLKKLRNQLYLNNDNKKHIALKHYSSTLKNISEENLYRAALDSSITIEIIKITSSFLQENDWNIRANILFELKKYSDYNSLRIAEEIFKNLEKIANYPRAGMTSAISNEILYLAMDYFPYTFNKKDKQRIIEISKNCSQIAFAMAYDGFIHLRNYAIATTGLQLLKLIYSRGQQNKIGELVEIVLKEYKELENTLQRPDRKDLENSKRITLAFKQDLNNPGIRIPKQITEDLSDLIINSQLNR